MKKDEKNMKKVLRYPINPLLCPYRQRETNMKTNLLNPVQYDEAIMELLRNNKQSESLQLVINLLRDARKLAELKLEKDIAKQARKEARQAEVRELKEYREWALNN